MSATCRMTFDLFLRCLKECADNMDETVFVYRNAAGEDEDCIIGYITQYDPVHPYWAGTGCDVEHGADFHSAEELVNAPIYEGKSIRERWNDIGISMLGMIDTASWMAHLCSFASEVAFDETANCWYLKRERA